MDKVTKVGYVVIDTYYNIDNQVCKVSVTNRVFSSKKKAQEWIVSTNGAGLLQKVSKYANANNMSVKLYEMDDDGMTYLVDVIDGDKSYHTIQYTIAPIKYIEGGSCLC